MSGLRDLGTSGGMVALLVALFAVIRRRQSRAAASRTDAQPPGAVV